MSTFKMAQAKMKSRVMVAMNSVFAAGREIEKKHIERIGSIIDEQRTLLRKISKRSFSKLKYSSTCSKPIIQLEASNYKP